MINTFVLFESWLKKKRDSRCISANSDSCGGGGGGGGIGFFFGGGGGSVNGNDGSGGGGGGGWSDSSSRLHWERVSGYKIGINESRL